MRDMTRRPTTPRSKTKKPALDDAELWAQWSKSVPGRKPGKPRVGDHGGVPGADSDPMASEGTPRPNDKSSGRSSAQSTGRESDPNTTSKDTTTHQKKVAAAPVPAPPGLATFDHKHRRKLSTGRIKIAARIDLHGMRQHEARGALLHFLNSAHQRGHRWVLVITGKGGAIRSHLDHDTIEPEDPMRIGYGADARGVLRRVVPGWLEEPQFRAIVVSHTAAAPHHGGEGARYVQLRAARKHRP